MKIRSLQVMNRKMLKECICMTVAMAKKHVFINSNKSNNIRCSAVESLETKKLCNLSLLWQRTPGISFFFKVTGLVQKKYKLAFDNVKH